MIDVTFAGALGDRAVVAGRRMTRAPEWPPAAGSFLGLFAMIEVVLRPEESGSILSVALLLALCATVPLAFARAQIDWAAATITLATLLTLLAYGRPTGAGLVAQLVVFYLLGRRRSWRISALMLLPFLAYAIVVPLEGDRADRLFAVLLASMTAAAIGLGNARRIRGEAKERDAAEQAIADTLLEHAARGERARIARELHDVVAHHISMIAVQAETARLTTSGIPAEGAERLVAIGDTARAALTEMRRLLGVLREDARSDTTRKPQPNLQELIELIDGARDSAGASTRLIVRGPVVPLDPGIELTAYRIVQEALTNSRRHAPGAAVDVELDYTGDALHVRIRDNGPGGPADTPAAESLVAGHGLLGMRERAATVGGDVRAGPAPVGGFLVEARLPVPGVPVDAAVE